MLTLARTVLVGFVLLLAAIRPPAAHGQCVGPETEQDVFDSVAADIQLISNSAGDFAYGRLTCDGHYWQQRNDSGNYVWRCGFGGDYLSPQATRLTPPAGNPGFHHYCEPVCGESGSLSEITQVFFAALTGGACHEFQWNFPTFQNKSSVYYKRICVPDQSWDAPTCQTCVGESATACVHPTPRSLVLASRPDMVLPSPLGDRTIERTYRTGLVGDVAAGDGMFGKGWWANFEYRIGGAGAAGVMLFDAAGRKTFYQNSGTEGVYRSPDDKGGFIRKAADGSYLWLDARGTSYQFDSSGYILSIADIHGNRETFDYGIVAGRITRLTDRHGREISFDYQGTTHVTRLLGPSIAANPAGVYATYSYDGNGNLTGVSYPDGNALVYGYENSSWPSHLTRFMVSGPQGPNLRQLFQYDTQGRVSAASEGPEGRSYHLTYSSEQLVVDQEYPGLGQKTLYHTTVTEWTDTDWDFQINGAEAARSQRTYSYENRGGADVITKIEDGGCGCAAENDFDSSFHVVRSKDDRGVTALMAYDAQGKMTSLTEAAGTTDERTTTYEYVYPAIQTIPGQILEKTMRQQSVVSADSDKVSTEIYDPATGRLLARRQQGFRVDGSLETSETVYTYTASGAIQTIDGPRPGTVDKIEYAYHGEGALSPGMLWKITQPGGVVTTFQRYDGLGNLLLKADANGHETTYAYDSRGLLQTRTTVEGTTRYEYDAQGNITNITYPKGNSVSYRYGQSGLKQISDATGRIEFGYTNGNKTSESVYDAAGALTKSTFHDYDGKNRLWLSHRASGDFEEFLYDENGNVTARRLYAAVAPTVPFKTTVLGYDFLNRLATVSVADDPYHVSYAYDAQGNLSTVTDPVGQVTRFLYDDRGRQGRVVSPETGTTEFGRDEAGNVVSRTDNLNRLITYAYDGLNRLTDITYPDSTQPVHYRYDNYSAGSYPDSVGRLTEVTDASGVRRHFYNPAGRLSKTVHSIDALVFTTEYGYDANGNLATLTYPGGRTIHYDHDPASDRVQSVTSWKNGIPTVLAAGVTHKPFGPMNGLGYGNGTHLVKTYENLTYRLGSIEVTGPLGDPLPTRGYEYDPAGNIHAITRDLPGGLESDQFEYDLKDRLSIWDKTGRMQSFTYDANGNRQSLADDGQFTAYAYDSVARNILASSAGAENLVYDYDPLGNVTGLGTKNLVYDINGRLTRVEDEGVTLGEYVHNIDGQRVKKIASGQTTYYEYDAGGRLLHEYRQDVGTAVDYVYLGSEPLAMLVSDSPTGSFVVAPSAGENGSITPAVAQTVGFNQTATFIVTPNAGYQIGSVSGCGGTLAGSTFTTAAITGDCTVTASFVPEYYVVSASAGAHGNIAPSVPLLVEYRQTTVFIVTPDAGYHVDSVVGCDGTLDGDVYSTGPIVSDCNVTATFTANSYTVTAEAMANGSISPSGEQVVECPQTVSFTVTPDTGYHISIVSGCGGSLVGNIFTTAPILDDCSVTASFAPDTFAVVGTAGPNGSISPADVQVEYQQTTVFTVTPNTGYSIQSVSGCGGTLSNSWYTTAPINGDCAVTAAFAIDRYLVNSTTSANGSISPYGYQVVEYQQTRSFTVTPNPGFYAHVTGCGGSLDGDTYTTGPILDHCTISAGFSPILYTVATETIGGGTIDPGLYQGVTYNSTRQFSVTASAGYHLAEASGCGGSVISFVDGVYTYETEPIQADCTVTATFDIGSRYTLSAIISGGGSGTVTSTPPGIDCGSLCAAEYDRETAVSLSQIPAAGSLFVGWSGGGCAGVGACSVAMSAAQSVTATYARNILVAFPDGGEVLTRKANYWVNWYPQDSPGTSVMIELLKAGSVCKTVAKKTLMQDGAYWWKVPNKLPAGSDYQIRVTSKEDGAFVDVSDAYFTIQ